MKKKPHKATPPPKLKAPPKKKPVQKTPKPPATVKPDVPPEDLSHFGRQPIEFYIARYGNRFRVIDNIGFVYSNGRWVAVDVDGFAYTAREICPGDPQFVAV